MFFWCWFSHTTFIVPETNRAELLWNPSAVIHITAWGSFLLESTFQNIHPSSIPVSSFQGHEDHHHIQQWQCEGRRTGCKFITIPKKQNSDLLFFVFLFTNRSSKFSCYLSTNLSWLTLYTDSSIQNIFLCPLISFHLTSLIHVCSWLQQLHSGSV